MSSDGSKRPLVDHFGVAWDNLLPSWAPLGRLLSLPWALLGLSWLLLGASWLLLGASGLLLGVSWVMLGVPIT